MVKINHPLPRTRRCELLDVARSTSYYRPAPVSVDDMALMTRIDRIHTSQPFRGSRRIVDALADQANQVWASDITYLPMENGFTYLTVIMDWFSRKVLSWRLSNSMDSSFCVDALEEAIHRYGKPQGNQYTGEAFTDVLKDNDIDISMDGKGAWRDNVFVERL